jgi:hypothetical protein
MKEKTDPQKYIFPKPMGAGAPIMTDPMGMYTGITTDPDEIPIQDADDL